MKRHLTKVTDQLNTSFNHAEFNFLHRFVMQELLETENDYVKDLGLVVDVSIYTNRHFTELLSLFFCRENHVLEIHACDILLK